MRKRLDRSRLLVSVGISIGVVLIAFGFASGITGDEAREFPASIERMSPADGDRVLRQSQVIIDFVVGYEASLNIDGIELPVTRLDELTTGGAQPAPGAQVELPATAVFDPGNNVLSFQPQDGALIESFAQGEHVATVRYWKILEGPAKSRTYQWRFVTD
ncbi:MAG: hypothetical protein RL552_758 [Actinomycetota bacterium]|jgi:hypothetical protein